MVNNLKTFNTTGICNPDKNYMVDITDRLQYMKKMIDNGDYFCINRSRQHAKTTTLHALKKYLSADYAVINISFQKLNTDIYKNVESFVISITDVFIRNILYAKNLDNDIKEYAKSIKKDLIHEGNTMIALFNKFTELCSISKKPIVFIIDEVDNASNYEIFVDFLAQLRAGYLERDEIPAFHSVILCGLYDVKNLKKKMRPDEEHQTNSPWNIAKDFNYDMRLHENGISSMLENYADEHNIYINTAELSRLIFDYTDGYPFLVSKICQIIDESNGEISWDKQGFLKAVKILLLEKNTLFESLNGKINEYPELKKKLNDILFSGTKLSYNQFDYAVNLAEMFGFVKNDNGVIAVSNRIFELILYDMLIINSDYKKGNIFYEYRLDKNQFIDNGDLNVERVLEKFVQHFDEVYGDQDIRFLEDEGRRFFLLYLRPIINGTGHYYIEARTRNLERTDVIIDYNGKQYIIELKIWRGDSYNKRGEQQLINYLDYYGIDKGYMLSFSFSKKKKVGLHEVKLGNKVLVEALV